jgi:hypothetical protein
VRKLTFRPVDAEVKDGVVVDGGVVDTERGSNLRNGRRKRSEEERDAQNVRVTLTIS